jgi:hypothetical protein
METPYHILGSGDVLLHECYTEEAARRWISGYTRWSDWGGYDFIRLDYYGTEENFPIAYFYPED